MSRHGPAPSRPRTHPLAVDPDVPADLAGHRFCTCGAREDHERHTLPTTDPATRALTARMVGDRED
jgi:hypothetical protein